MHAQKIHLKIDPKAVVPVPAEELDRLVRFARFGLLVELGTVEAICDPELSDGLDDAEQRELALEDVRRYGELVEELLP